MLPIVARQICNKAASFLHSSKLLPEHDYFSLVNNTKQLYISFLGIMCNKFNDQSLNS